MRLYSAVLKDILRDLMNVTEQDCCAGHCCPLNNTRISSVLISAKGFLYSESSRTPLFCRVKAKILNCPRKSCRDWPFLSLISSYLPTPFISSYPHLSA